MWRDCLVFVVLKFRPWSRTTGAKITKYPKSTHGPWLEFTEAVRCNAETYVVLHATSSITLNGRTTDFTEGLESGDVERVLGRKDEVRGPHCLEFTSAPNSAACLQLSLEDNGGLVPLHGFIKAIHKWERT